MGAAVVQGKADPECAALRAALVADLLKSWKMRCCGTFLQPSDSFRNG
jgi:hypothetical protein